MRKRLLALAAALLVLSACSVPDVAHLTAEPLSPGSASSSQVPTSAAAGSTESSQLPPSGSTNAPGSIAASIGAGAVTPWGLVTQDDIDRAAAVVAGMTPTHRAGSVIMASTADAVGTSEVSDLGLGGVILMGNNGVIDGTKSGTPSQILGVTQALSGQVSPALAGFPLLIGTDQEYGDVTRLQNGFTDLPGASELGSIADLSTAVQVTHDVAAVAAAEMVAVGVNLDFAPVSDVLPTTGVSAIGNRSYSSDPARVAALVAAAVQGYQSGGVAATVKHFPGIGELSADSHEALQALKTDCNRWNNSASAPVRSGVNAGVSVVMTGHTLFPAVDTGSEPTSLSSVVVSDLLRGDPAAPLSSGCIPVGFRGLAVTDSLQMVPISGTYSSGEAAWRALAAGQDLLLMPVRPADAVTGIVGAVADGSLAESRLNEAAVRVLALRSALSRAPQLGLDVVKSQDHLNVAARARTAING